MVCSIHFHALFRGVHDSLSCFIPLLRGARDSLSCFIRRPRGAQNSPSCFIRRPRGARNQRAPPRKVPLTANDRGGCETEAKFNMRSRGLSHEATPRHHCSCRYSAQHAGPRARCPPDSPIGRNNDAQVNLNRSSPRNLKRQQSHQLGIVIDGFR